MARQKKITADEWILLSVFAAALVNDDATGASACFETKPDGSCSLNRGLFTAIMNEIKENAADNIGQARNPYEMMETMQLVNLPTERLLQELSTECEAKLCRLGEICEDPQVKDKYAAICRAVMCWSQGLEEDELPENGIPFKGSRSAELNGSPFEDGDWFDDADEYEDDEIFKNYDAELKPFRPAGSALVISVKFESGCYRHIRINRAATLAHLASAIVHGFDGINNEAHAFTIPGKGKEVVYDSDGLKGVIPRSDEAIVRDTLTVGLAFTFSFGTEFSARFDCTVLREVDEPGDGSASVIRRSGDINW